MGGVSPPTVALTDELQGRTVMPRKKSTSPNLDTPAQNIEQGKWWVANDAPWYGFANVSLNEGDKEAFYAWLEENAADCPALLEDIVNEGMKYSCAYDRENECFLVTFTGCLVQGSTTRAATVTRAGTWREADALAVWKHYELLAEDYGSLLTTGRKRNWG